MRQLTQYEVQRYNNYYTIIKINLQNIKFIKINMDYIPKNFIIIIIIYNIHDRDFFSPAHVVFIHNNIYHMCRREKFTIMYIII